MGHTAAGHTLRIECNMLTHAGASSTGMYSKSLHLINYKLKYVKQVFYKRRLEHIL